MGMRCKSNFDADLKAFGQKVMENMIDAMDEAGTNAVDRIRGTRTFGDVTERLINSIGYGVVVNGEVIRSGGFGGGEGGRKGKDFLSSIASTVSFGLVIVAGMEYALYVERKGYVVLDGGTLGVTEDLKRILLKKRV